MFYIDSNDKKRQRKIKYCFCFENIKAPYWQKLTPNKQIFITRLDYLR